MNLGSIKAVFMFVKNIKQSSAWYAEVFNLPLAIAEKNFALIKVGEVELCFHRADSKSPVSTGNSVTYWSVECLANSMKKLQEKGGSIYRGPIPIPESREGICQIKDPFGNVFGLQGAYEN